MKKRGRGRIKIFEITVLNQTLIGNVKINGKEPEPHERKTINFLAL